jgi:anion-transporting  ArsA/GET3 family ATPase
VVVSAAEPDALREASFFVDRLSSEHMPLAGLILNRTHPMLCALPVERAIDGIETLQETQQENLNTGTTTNGAAELTGAVLRIHADRGSTAKREIRLLSRFTGANPNIAIVGVPSLPFDVSDLEALGAIADQLTSVGDGGAAVSKGRGSN